MKLNNKDFLDVSKYLEDDYFITCFISERGLGKTHSALHYVNKKNKETGKKFVITRLTYEVFKKFADDISNIDNLKCSLEKQNIKRDGEVVGYLSSLNTYANSKGGNYQDVEYMIFDEFNEDLYIENAYAKFVMLVDTFKRHKSNFKCLLMGNMINKNNWFLNAMGIRPNWKSEEDMIYYIKEYGVKVVIIGKNTFNKLAKARRSINKLASADPSAHAFYNEREFLNDDTDMVVNFVKWVKPTFQPIFSFRYGEYKYIFGKYVEENGEIYFFCDRISIFYNEYLDNLIEFGFDLLGSIGSKKTKPLEDKEIENFQQQFFIIAKQEKLKYGSFDTYEDLQRFVSLGILF